MSRKKLLKALKGRDSAGVLRKHMLELFAKAGLVPKKIRVTADGGGSLTSEMTARVVAVGPIVWNDQLTLVDDWTIHVAVSGWSPAWPALIVKNLEESVASSAEAVFCSMFTKTLCKESKLDVVWQWAAELDADGAEIGEEFLGITARTRFGTWHVKPTDAAFAAAHAKIAEMHGSWKSAKEEHAMLSDLFA